MSIADEAAGHIEIALLDSRDAEVRRNDARIDRRSQVQLLNDVVCQRSDVCWLRLVELGELEE